MLAIEVETCPEEGVTLSALTKTLETHPVKACLFSTTLSNPLGVSNTGIYMSIDLDPGLFVCRLAHTTNMSFALSRAH